MGHRPFLVGVRFLLPEWTKNEAMQMQKGFLMICEVCNNYNINEIVYEQIFHKLHSAV